MGSDDLFHKRKAKQVSELKRTQAKRALISAKASGADNPTTLGHELVEYLQRLGRNGEIR